MKAAVVDGFGQVPEYRDFTDPPLGDEYIRVRVKAAALENFDKMTVAGTHYASRQLFPAFPAVVGHSGVGVLDDGSVVAFGGTTPPYGTMAEIASIPNQYRNYLTSVPAHVDVALAAALPASALTSLLALRHVAKLQPGETVLVNGATGVSGKLAAQIARILGAGRIIATGRDRGRLSAVTALGADATIDISVADDDVVASFKREAGEGYDIVLNFLWGRPTELLMSMLVPEEAGFARHRTRFVQIGESAGSAISLPAEALRTSGLEMTGAGSIPPEVVPDAVRQVWDWMSEGVLSMEIETVPLHDLSRVWERKTGGKRIVVTM